MKTLNKITLLIGMSITSLLSAEYSGQGELSLHSWSSEKEIVEGNLKYKWKLWTLVGEPVDELVAQWNIQNVDFHNESSEIKKLLKDPDSDSLKYKVCEGSETSGCIPKDIMEKASIVDLKLIGHGHPSGKYPKGDSFDNSMYSYVFDAGVMSKPYASYITAIQDKYGKWSYNTPGSKSWDNCFKNKTKDKSKQIMKSGVKLFDFRIRKIKFNFNDVKRYIIDRNKKYYKSQIDKEVEEKQGELDYIYAKRQRNGGSFDDPSAELELVEREKVINKMIQDSDSAINKRYASADASLKSEASSKSYLLQATKERVAKRRLPTKEIDGIWIDEDTGLMWQDAPYTQEETHAFKNGLKYNKVQTWEVAKSYCRELNYAGYTDWYLPSKSESKALYMKTPPLKNNDRAYDFWSSSEEGPGPDDKVYIIDGYRGNDFTYYKDSGFYIRCVRKNQLR